MPGALTWGWDPTNKVWLPMVVNAEGKLVIASVEDAEISQDTPQSLKHVPHGYYAAGPSYLPFKVSADGTLQTSAVVSGNLDDLDDVDVPTPTDQYLLYWDAATSTWKCKALVDADIPAAIARDTEVAADIATHAAIESAHHTKFTTTEHDTPTRHPLANLDPLVCSEAEADGKVTTHAALTTGVHGVGSDYIAKVAGSQQLVLPLAGGTLTGDLIIQKANPAVTLLPTSGQGRIQGQTAGGYDYHFFPNIPDHDMYFGYNSAFGVLGFGTAAAVARPAAVQFCYTTQARFYAAASGAAGVLRFYFDNAGNAYADVAWNTFSPKIAKTKEERIAQIDNAVKGSPVDFPVEEEYEEEGIKKMKQVGTRKRTAHNTSLQAALSLELVRDLFDEIKQLKAEIQALKSKPA